MTTYEAKLVETGGYYRRPCHVCGGSTEKNRIGTEVTVPVFDGGEAQLIICEFCLEAGNIDERLACHADRLERMATDLRGLVGRLKVPSYREWEDANQKAEQEVLREQLIDEGLSAEEVAARFAAQEKWGAGVVGRRLVFDRGDYIAGADAEEIKIGTRLVADMTSLEVGWVKWANGTKLCEDLETMTDDALLVDIRMGRAAEGYQPPDRDTLDDTDPRKWEVDGLGDPQDPWLFTIRLVLRPEGSTDDADALTFTTTTPGGRDAIFKLGKAYSLKMREGSIDGRQPIVELGVDVHDDPDLGRKKLPVLKVVGWTEPADDGVDRSKMVVDVKCPCGETHKATVGYMSDHEIKTLLGFNQFDPDVDPAEIAELRKELARRMVVS
jgi:hypothetical protein